MPENHKCKCPMCEQVFTPENGLTPEEHIARGIINAYKEMQERFLTVEIPCPRCGYDRMRPELLNNAYSRHADVYVCNECGTDEALRDINKNILPLTDWNIVSELIKYVCSLKCKDYIPEKDNCYPLSDNPACAESSKCNISAHMTSEGQYPQDK